MKLLSRSEEIILIAILKLGKNAYGVSIREQIFKDTGDMWSFASIYQPLDKLVMKEYARKIKGEPSAERGGKSKFFYEVTSDGKKALLEIRTAHDQVWAGVPRIALENGKG
jgi:PadR family transcriptional regulator PadR